MEQTRNCGNNGFDMYNIGDRCEYVQYAIEIERNPSSQGTESRPLYHIPLVSGAGRDDAR